MSVNRCPDADGTYGAFEHIMLKVLDHFKGVKIKDQVNITATKADDIATR
jgi:hypothetical protein